MLGRTSRSPCHGGRPAERSARCQTPSLSSRDEAKTAGTPSSAVGRRAARGGAKTEGSATECSTPAAAAIPQRRSPRDREDSRRGLEPAHAPLLPSAEAGVHPRLPALPLPTGSLLSPATSR